MYNLERRSRFLSLTILKSEIENYYKKDNQIKKVVGGSLERIGVVLKINYESVEPLFLVSPGSTRLTHCSKELELCQMGLKLCYDELRFLGLNEEIRLVS